MWLNVIQARLNSKQYSWPSSFLQEECVGRSQTLRRGSQHFTAHFGCRFYYSYFVTLALSWLTFLPAHSSLFSWWLPLTGLSWRPCVLRSDCSWPHLGTILPAHLLLMSKCLINIFSNTLYLGFQNTPKHPRASWITCSRMVLMKFKVFGNVIYNCVLLSSLFFSLQLKLKL